MGPFAIEAEGMPELVIHRLHNLAYSSQPAAQPLRPRHATMALRWAEDLGPIGQPPGLVVGLPLEALVDDIGPVSRGAHACQSRVFLPSGLPATSTWKPSYQPSRLLQPMSASPGSHPAPRRLASRVGTPELSRAS